MARLGLSCSVGEALKGQVFPEASRQEQIFQRTMRGPLDAFIEGKNVLLFAYGPTSSGKAHTMQGPQTDPGIIPRTLDRLFKLLGSQVSAGASVRQDRFEGVVFLGPGEEAAVLSSKSELLGEKVAHGAADFSTFHHPAGDSKDYSLFNSRFSDDGRYSMVQVLVWISCYEIYNEGLYELLVPPSTMAYGKAAGGGLRTLFKLGEDRAKCSFLHGLVEVPVRNADEAHPLLCLSRHNQSVAETSLNRSSSRSHCVFTVRLVCSLAGGQKWRVSTLMLCDLAGSDRPSKTGTGRLRLREAGRINNSLMVLGRCLEGLRQNRNTAAKQVRVPFQESKLTQVMQAFFTTGGHISLVVNICPALSMLEESVNALKFSAVACEVVPVQLETRRERCNRTVRRITELWHRSSQGEARSDSNVAVADVDYVPLDERDVKALVDIIEELEEELAETHPKLKWSDRNASGHEAKYKEYEEMVTALEQTKRMIRENSDREMTVRVSSACEITLMEMYPQPDRGSTMGLLGRCEEAERCVALLEERLHAQSTSEAPQQDLAAL
ncbi:kinesin-like protein KIF20A [Haemaphysalis longicornis]